MLRRFLALAAVLGLALTFTAAGWTAEVTIRIEGKTRTIFGSEPVRVDAANALDALRRASRLGEFHVALERASFGDYVSQIGKYRAGGNSGWVFKVNGVSPSVGADKVRLRNGDRVLWYWATFGKAGGPPTLELQALPGNCYRVVAIDDAGKRRAAREVTLRVDGRSVATSGGRGCVGPHAGLVRATAPGAVRSNAVN